MCVVYSVINRWDSKHCYQSVGMLLMKSRDFFPNQINVSIRYRCCIDILQKFQNLQNKSKLNRSHS